MDRNKTLSRIRGPYPSERKDFEWVFHADRKLSHRLNKVAGRKFYLRYFHDIRTFQVVEATRRVSKRDKRHAVKVAFRIGAYLKTRLPPEVIAQCVAASIRFQAAQVASNSRATTASAGAHTHQISGVPVRTP